MQAAVSRQSNADTPALIIGVRVPSRSILHRDPGAGLERCREGGRLRDDTRPGVAPNAVAEATGKPAAPGRPVPSAPSEEKTRRRRIEGWILTHGRWRSRSADGSRERLQAESPQCVRAAGEGHRHQAMAGRRMKAMGGVEIHASAWPEATPGVAGL
jgi:hypothetical protein